MDPAKLQLHRHQPSTYEISICPSTSKRLIFDEKMLGIWARHLRSYVVWILPFGYLETYHVS